MGREERVNDKTMRRLIFTDQNVVFFRLLYESFHSRGANRERQISSSDRKSEARILRALKGISDPVGPEPKDGAIDLRLRKLQDTGGTIELQQQDFARLQRYLSEAPLPSAVSDIVDDLNQFLEKAEAVETA